MTTAETLQTIAIVVTGIAVIVALVNAQRAITESRKASRVNARREATYPIVDWLHDATAALSGWLEHRRSLVTKQPTSEQIRNDAAELTTTHNRIGSRALLIFGPGHPALVELGKASRAFSDAVDTLGSPVPFSHHRPIDDILEDWNNATRNAYAELAKACDLDTQDWQTHAPPDVTDA